ncbi:hypothetical protein PHMEG_00014137 [Phytophthora megakarya]|uniref:Uncharacterized protein n=1 Tax=Phytophthora megakarya TaxID=4795 RepID=A0A225W4Q6_9STRA|nr:hypothetical protein PHMEG_00014137 [Phytophthora megakarya]
MQIELTTMKLSYPKTVGSKIETQMNMKWIEFPIRIYRDVLVHWRDTKIQLGWTKRNSTVAPYFMSFCETAPIPTGSE